MITMIAFAAFLLVTVVAYLLFSVTERRSERAELLRKRLAALEAAQVRHPNPDLVILRDELLSEIPALNKLLVRSNRVAAVSKLLSQAGLSIRPGKFLLIVVASSMTCAFVVRMFGFSALFLPLALAAGAVIPFSIVRWKRNRRFRQFERQFPEVIELLARAVRAGHAFSTALEMITTESSEPVAGEFKQIFDEQRFGLPLRDALLNFGERIPTMDVKFFVTTVLLQRETGGNLAEILDKLSYLMRERFKILRQVKVYTAQGRMSFIILMLLAPAVALATYFLNPAFVGPMFHDPLGQAMVFTAVCMQITGFFVIRKIIDIKV